MEAWERVERTITGKVRGQRQPGSGSGRRRKADIQTDRYLIEVKTTRNPYHITIQRVWLDKVLLESEQCGKLPALVIHSTGSNTEYWFMLECQKPNPADPGWKTRKISIYPVIEIDRIESLLAYWYISTAPPETGEKETDGDR